MFWNGIFQIKIRHEYVNEKYNTHVYEYMLSLGNSFSAKIKGVRVTLRKRTNVISPFSFLSLGWCFANHKGVP
jgi:hypothetical protein